MAGVREQKKRATRAAIVRAAIKLFSENGFDKTSIEQLAREAGIGKSTVYGYFKAKSEIFLAFCDDEMDHAFAELAKIRDPKSGLLDQLLTVFMAQFRYVVKDREFGRIFCQEMSFPGELTALQCKELEDRYLRELGKIMKAAMDRGELRTDQEMLHVIGHFYALYLIVLSSWYTGRLTSEEEVAATLAALLRQALEGLAPVSSSRNVESPATEVV